MSASRIGWMLSGVLAAAAWAGQPPPTQPAPGGAESPATAGPGSPASPASDAGDPDDDFIEFLGADDDAVRWESLKNSAQRQGLPPGSPPQDTTP